MKIKLPKNSKIPEFGTEIRKSTVIKKSGDTSEYIIVESPHADEVKDIVESIITKLDKQDNPILIRSPWMSGSFYLAILLIVLTFLSVIAKAVPIFIFPIIVIGALLAVSIVGAFQLRQDKRLSQKKFFELMALTFKYISLFNKRAK